MNNIMPASSLAPAELRSRIQQFEQAILEHEQIDIPVTQYFSDGVYMREITIPAGCLLTGKIHKHPCLSIVLTGRMEVITDQGPKIIQAPLVYESPAGVKRAGKALEECRWLTVHPYDGPERPEAEMADLLTVNTFEELEQFRQERIT
jgi:quercetin dioxygenase-like cupin family protein